LQPKQSSVAESPPKKSQARECTIFHTQALKDDSLQARSAVMAENGAFAVEHSHDRPSSCGG
jgi:hypothetical protein